MFNQSSNQAIKQSCPAQVSLLVINQKSIITRSSSSADENRYQSINQSIITRKSSSADENRYQSTNQSNNNNPQEKLCRQKSLFQSINQSNKNNPQE